MDKISFFNMVGVILYYKIMNKIKKKFEIFKCCFCMVIGNKEWKWKYRWKWKRWEMFVNKCI